MLLYHAVIASLGMGLILKILVTIQHIAGAKGIVIQNGGIQDVSHQLHGWIHVCFES